MGINPIQLDEYFYNLSLHGLLDPEEFLQIMMKLEKVCATNSLRILEFMDALKKVGEE